MEVKHPILVPYLKSTRTSSFNDKCEPKLFADTDDQGGKVFLWLAIGFEISSGGSSDHR